MIVKGKNPFNHDLTNAIHFGRQRIIVAENYRMVGYQYSWIGKCIWWM